MELADVITRINGPSNVSRRNLHGSVAHQLATLIISGRIKPGDVLPNEEELSASLSVSRTAFREGMRVLAAKGLVVTRPKSGTKVTPRAKWNILDPDVLSWHFEVEPSPKFIVALFELRRIVEPAAAALAAARSTAEDRAAMTGALERMRGNPPGSVDGLDADLAFHQAILQAAGNEALLALSSVIGSTLRWSARLKLMARPKVFQTSLPEHVMVQEAIVRRDGTAAAERMTLLIDNSLAQTLEVLDEHGPALQAAVDAAGLAKGFAVGRPKIAG